MALLIVDGQELPPPCGLTVEYLSIGSADLAADGSTVADRVAVKRRADVRWVGLSGEEAAQALTALTNGVFLAVELPEPLSCGRESLVMRVTALKAELMTVDGGRPGLVRELTAVLMER